LALVPFRSESTVVISRNDRTMWVPQDHIWCVLANVTTVQRAMLVSRLALTKAGETTIPRRALEVHYCVH
jgi:hypothetical protein